MAERVNITEIDALRAFKADLLIYLSKARPTLGEVTADVLRMKLWLENEKRLHWENLVKRRLKILESAQAELFSARISSIHEVSTVQQMAVRKAKQALDE